MFKFHKININPNDRPLAIEGIETLIRSLQAGNKLSDEYIHSQIQFFYDAAVDEACHRIFVHLKKRGK